MDIDGVVPSLGEFLRARRALVTPSAHGIPEGRRRTPGLRREEVATLAGISTAYYVRLEQGRERHPSTAVIGSLAGALLLDAEAEAYLRMLAEPTPPPRRVRRTGEAATGINALLDAWMDTPALLYGRHMDLLAINPLGRALFSWLGAETNLLRGIFLDPAARVFYRDWSVIAEGCVAALRADNADWHDQRLVELVGALCLRSQEFATLWARHEVRAKRSSVKHFQHELVGPLTLAFENLTVAGATGQHLVVYHAEPGSPSAAALTKLANTVRTPRPPA